LPGGAASATGAVAVVTTGESEDLGVSGCGEQAPIISTTDNATAILECKPARMGGISVWDECQQIWEGGMHDACAFHPALVLPG